MVKSGSDPLFPIILSLETKIDAAGKIARKKREF